MKKRHQWYLIASLALVAILALAGCAGAAPEAAAPAEEAAVEEAPEGQIENHQTRGSGESILE